MIVFIKNWLKRRKRQKIWQKAFFRNMTVNAIWEPIIGEDINGEPWTQLHWKKYEEYQKDVLQLSRKYADRKLKEYDKRIDNT